jgi:CRISPR/Cas system endoribonuclease Cas6 (RAMP superfamily)
MPLKLRFHLGGDPPPHAFQHADGLRRLVLDWLALGGGPDLATALHDANQPNPYAISPLYAHKDALWFEVAVLADPFVAPICEGADRYGTDLRLGPQLFRRVSMEKRGEVSWERLLRSREPLLAMSVRLVTPTAHHAPGPYRKAVVLPAPETYFGSWFDRWNLCSPCPFPESLLETVRMNVGISACRGQTETVLLDARRRFIGFVGEVTFRLLKPEMAAPEEKVALAALARFSNYCATGVETVRGMGQTRTMLEGR